MQDKINILPAAPADAAGIVSLVNSAYRDHEAGGWTTEATYISGDRITVPGILETMATPGQTVFKCENEAGELLGCVLLELHEDSIHLGMLSISPKLQNSGLGRQMIAFGEDYARSRQKKQVVITVVYLRYELIAWYERRGFTATGRTIPFPDNVGELHEPIHFIEMAKPV